MEVKVARLEEKIAVLQEEVTSLKSGMVKVFFGGDGQAGIMERMARTEQNIERITRMQEEQSKTMAELANAQARQTTMFVEQAGQMVTIRESVTALSETIKTHVDDKELEDTVEEHIEDDTLHTVVGLFGNKKVLTGVVVSIVVLIFLVTGQEGSLLDLIRRFFGF
jgi:uncharacterized small protein (DUF1192 family)